MIRQQKGDAALSSLETKTEAVTEGEKSPARLFLLFLVCGLATAATVVIGDVLIQLAAIVSLTIIFLAAFMFARRNKSLEHLREVFFAFFVFAFVAVIGGVIGGVANLAAGQALGFAADAVTVILLIIVMTKASGRSLSSLYLKRGNLRLGLKVGFATFLVFNISIIVGFQLIFSTSKGVTLDKIFSHDPPSTRGKRSCGSADSFYATPTSSRRQSSPSHISHPNTNGSDPSSSSPSSS